MAIVKLAAAQTSASSAAGGQETVATLPQRQYVVVALGLFVGGYIAAHFVQARFHPNMSNLPHINAGISVFALFYLLAQAIERLLVPVSWFGGGFLGGTGANRTKKGVAMVRQKATVNALSSPGAPNTLTAANAKHDSEQYSVNLTATTFGLASAAAMLASSYTGAFLLNTVGVASPPRLDLLVTGLAIAGGTKPLHDLISNISTASTGTGDS